MDKIKYLGEEGTITIVNEIDKNKVLTQNSIGSIASKYILKDGTLKYNEVATEDIDKRNAVAIGGESSATGKYSMSVGGGNVISGDFSSALGMANNVSGQYSTAIGQNCSISAGKKNVYIGTYKSSTLENPRYTAPAVTTQSASIKNTAFNPNLEEFSVSDPALENISDLDRPLDSVAVQAAFDYPTPSEDFNFTELEHVPTDMSGYYSTCIGGNLQDNGTLNFLTGLNNITISGQLNSIFGSNNRIFGGAQNNACGNCNTIITHKNDLALYCATVEGYKNIIYNTGGCGHVEGAYNSLGKDIEVPKATSGTPAADMQQYGFGSHVEGIQNTCTADRAHAEGYRTVVEGNCAHAEGHYTQALNRSEHACGQYNLSTKSTDEKLRTVFSIGNANPDWENGRHNAVEVKFNGDIFIQPQTSTDSSKIHTTTAPMKRLQTWMGEKQDVQKFEDTSGTAITLKPNVYYNITIKDSATLTLEPPTDETISNVYQFCFDVDSSVPKITFPNVIWEDSSYIAGNSHYEFTIRYVKGTYYGSKKGWIKQL